MFSLFNNPDSISPCRQVHSFTVIHGPHPGSSGCNDCFKGTQHTGEDGARLSIDTQALSYTSSNLGTPDTSVMESRSIDFSIVFVKLLLLFCFLFDVDEGNRHMIANHFCPELNVKQSFPVLYRMMRLSVKSLSYPQSGTPVVSTPINLDLLSGALILLMYEHRWPTVRQENIIAGTTRMFPRSWREGLVQSQGY